MSPLVKMLASAGQASTPAMLRQTLTRAIESLKPEAHVPAQSSAWRVYEVLHYRFVQQWSQEEVADQLGLSVRHLKREQRKALEVLAERLAERFDLEIDLGQEPSADSAAEEQDEESPSADGELQWIEKLPPGKPVDLLAALAVVQDLVQSIAARYNVDVEIAAGEPVPPLSIHAVVVRQILLSLLCVAIPRAAGGKVIVSVRPQRWAVEIRIQGESPQPQPGRAPEDDANLDVARQLVSTYGGSVSWPEPAAPFAATLVLPAAVPVLVIDDNPDALRLFQRYATGTRYLVSGAQDPEQAFALACESPPQVIVLDVMMPEVDGWEFLGRLKQHPLTSGIPVLACTILAQEELAFSLGVSAFVRKPVSRQDFLAALDRLLSSPEP